MTTKKQLQAEYKTADDYLKAHPKAFNNEDQANIDQAKATKTRVNRELAIIAEQERLAAIAVADAKDMEADKKESAKNLPEIESLFLALDSLIQGRRGGIMTTCIGLHREIKQELEARKVVLSG